MPTPHLRHRSPADPGFCETLGFLNKPPAMRRSQNRGGDTRGTGSALPQNEYFMVMDSWSRSAKG